MAHVVASRAGRRAGASDAPGLGELERAHDAAAVVRVDARGGGRVALGEQRVGRLGPSCVVEALHRSRAPGAGGGGSSSADERGAEVEAGAADDDRRAAGGDDLVDRRVREPLVLADRDLVVERHDARRAAPGTSAPR